MTRGLKKFSFKLKVEKKSFDRQQPFDPDFSSRFTRLRLSRVQLCKIIIMSEGIKLYSILFLLMITLIPILSSSFTETTLNSGLLFEKVTQKEIPINGRKLSFSRKISVAPLYSALDKLEEATLQYTNACHQAQELIKAKDEDYQGIMAARKQEYGVDPYTLKVGPDEFMRIASTSCNKIQGQLFEIRNEFDFNLLFTRRNEFKVIPANIYLDTQANRLRYVSDDY